MVQHLPHGLPYGAVSLFGVSLQREPIIGHQLPQSVLYVQQQPVKLISGCSFNAHWRVLSSLAVVPRGLRHLSLHGVCRSAVRKTPGRIGVVAARREGALTESELSPHGAKEHLWKMTY